MRNTFTLICLLFSTIINAQINVSTIDFPNGHPRYLTTQDGKEEIISLIQQEQWAADVFTKLKERTDKYIDYTDAQPDWLLSRLAMNWNSRATDVYIRGEVFDHAGGERAPVPTVRYNGTRGTVATHGRPRLEDVLPYDDVNGNITFCNNATPERTMESVHPSKTGRNIEGLNKEIVGIARDAAFLYWLSGEEKYAELAAGVFDTYMQGIYYRNVPKDLNNGHQQTLVGMTTFEVIHESILYDLIPLYDFLYNYLAERKSEAMDIYAGGFKKWADNIIANGVPHNNWNLMQARYIMDIGMILEDNENYSDDKGRNYYIDYVLNQSSIRQWSLQELADYGYDQQTGIWAECPGYASVVLHDYSGFTTLFDRNLNYDLVAGMPIIAKAAAATPQYLFPNKMICGFGDTHPTYLKKEFFTKMIQNAQVNNKNAQEEYFTALYKCLYPQPKIDVASPQNVRVAVSSFFDEKPIGLNPAIKAGNIEDYVSPLFYAPNVSWLVQRNGMNPRHSLMISLNGSDGNHMHANGISMELYGKGYVLAPDAGIGKSSYSGLDYLEYYSQFPSHNTVCVDGISSYPIMKSNHSFKVQSSFPEAATTETPFMPVTFSELYFREPESRADQTRMTSIVTTSPQTGYYVDVFRSRKELGGDKMHDYFYHNLGQTMNVTATDGTDLNLQPTEELAFAGAHLYAYSYIFDKKMAKTAKDIKATYIMNMPDGDDITMNMWMKGENDREIYSALSPYNDGYCRTPDMPYNLKEQSTLTYVARQKGEAWSRPFVAIYEPSSVNEPSHITNVTFPAIKGEDIAGAIAIYVEQTDGRNDLILSSDNPAHLVKTGQIEAKATYALWGVKGGNDQIIFMGNGLEVKTPEINIVSKSLASVLLENRDGKWFYTASAPCTVTMGKKKYKLIETSHLQTVDK